MIEGNIVFNYSIPLFGLMAQSLFGKYWRMTIVEYLLFCTTLFCLNDKGWVEKKGRWN